VTVGTRLASPCYYEDTILSSIVYYANDLRFILLTICTNIPEIRCNA
jgi:hypothetical protein